MTFNIMDHIKGRTYPEKSVSVYFDEASAREIEDLEKYANSERDGDKVAEAEKEIEALREKLNKASLVFHLRGFPEDIKKALVDSANDKHGTETSEERNIYLDVEALRLSIVGVENGKGEKGELPTYDHLEAVLKALPTSQRNLLMETVVYLSYTSTEYELDTVNPDF